MADAFDIWLTNKLFVVGAEVSSPKELQLSKQRLKKVLAAANEAAHAPSAAEQALIADVVRDALSEDPKIKGSDLAKLARSAARAYRAGVEAISQPGARSPRSSK